MILYECVYGMRPFQEMDPISAAMAAATDGLRPDFPDHAPDFFTEEERSLLPAVNLMISRCWAAAPNDRCAALFTECYSLKVVHCYSLLCIVDHCYSLRRSFTEGSSLLVYRRFFTARLPKVTHCSFAEGCFTAPFSTQSANVTDLVEQNKYLMDDSPQQITIFTSDREDFLLSHVTCVILRMCPWILRYAAPGVLSDPLHVYY